MGQNNLSGFWGEQIGARYFRKKRYKVVDYSYKTKYGEIDLIVSNKSYIVFVEIKLRKTERFAEGREFVDYYKQERIRKSAAYYLSRTDTGLQPRFDVLEIYAPEGTATKKPIITHLEGAFE